jgi:hypothetical protein
MLYAGSSLDEARVVFAAAIKHREATTCRDPGSVDCPGFFSVAVKTLFCRCTDFAGVCVVLATLLEVTRLRIATQPGRCRGRLHSVHPASQLK